MKKEMITIEDLKKTNWLIYESVVGSHAYGTYNLESDVDIRGIFIYPDSIYTQIEPPAPQIGDDKHDVVYYSLKRTFELLRGANPNIIELLWMPEDMIKVVTPEMRVLLENRKLFITKECFKTHSGYAYAQIKKAKGQNKKVHNPQPKEQPKKEDFCWVIDMRHKLHMNGLDVRPVPLKESELDLSEFHVSGLEHTGNVYRLYQYGEKAKGVFRGNDMLVPESVSLNDEKHRFAGLLIYNQDSYEKALKDHKSYWDWNNNRNEARWIDQEKGHLDYDAKNLMHCMRLLLSGENILKNGEPIVRFKGENLDYLMSIRNGEMAYEKLMEDVKEKMEAMDSLFKTSTIPDEIDEEKVIELYERIRRMKNENI